MEPQQEEAADELQDHLTYLQVSVSEPISRALASAGELRYLYPGLGEKSTLLHLAKQLRASNPLNTKARQKTSITRRQEASEGKLKWTALDEKRYKELTALFD